MMRLACQPIARRANQEDEVDGRFFAKRFECDRLETVADVLSCSIYVDLNVIRAGMAKTPEQSEFTSAFDRIRARWQQTQQEMGTLVSLPSEEEADAWLAPIFLDERAEAHSGPPRDAQENPEESPSPLCNPPGASRISNKGFLPLTLDEYLTLLDTLGRVVREGKRGVIPSDLPPILERLHVDPRKWFDKFWDAFQSAPCLTGEMPVTATGFG